MSPLFAEIFVNQTPCVLMTYLLWLHGLGCAEKEGKALNHVLCECAASNCHTDHVFCSHFSKLHRMTLMWVKEFMVINYMMVNGGPV